MFHSALKEEVKKFGAIQFLAADTTLVHEDKYVRFIPLVISGSLRVVRIEDDREILLYYIRPGESCIMSFLAGIHEDTSKIRAVVEDNAEIMFIPVAKAGEWVKQYPEWTDFIFKLYHQRFEELLNVVDAIAFKKLDERIITLLNKKADLYKTCEINITHQQLSEELGTTREVVSRLLKQLEKAGKITLQRNKIILISLL